MLQSSSLPCWECASTHPLTTSQLLLIKHTLINVLGTFSSVFSLQDDETTFTFCLWLVSHLSVSPGGLSIIILTVFHSQTHSPLFHFAIWCIETRYVMKSHKCPEVCRIILRIKMTFRPEWNKSCSDKASKGGKQQSDCFIYHLYGDIMNQGLYYFNFPDQFLHLGELICM